MGESTPRVWITGDGNVVGNNNQVTVIEKQYFAGKYERLQDAYIEPWLVFERVHLEHFVGRRWLLHKMDAFLHNHDRGYFILVAEAGLGKTTFLAWLVQQRGYLHHFAELAPGLEGVGTGLKNLAAQLVLACRLDNYEVGGFVSEAATRPDYLSRLLKQASDQRPKGQKIVLVIDALDEAGTPHGQNVLGLPEVLPEGVFIIASQRPVPVTLQVETTTTPRRPITLSASSENNRADMRCFLEQAATWPLIAQALSEKGYSIEQFIEVLLKKCGGVWIYLHHVVHEIEQGERSPLDLEALPTGVWQYYAQYWFAWREQDEAAWYQKYLPLLATLAAARDALSLKQLCSLAGVEESPKLSRVLRAEWSPLIQESEMGGTRRYRLYHASLKEFLSGQAVDSDSMLRGQQCLADELAEAARQAHLRIVDRYVEAWGGLEAGLPRLADPVMRDLDERYGVYHITTHLEMAGRVEDLHCLLKVETSDHSNAWYVVKETIGDIAGYMSDVERAWLLAEREYDFESIALTGRNIGLQCRYALITASLSGLARIPPSLLVALVKWGVWSPEQGVAYASRILDPLPRGEALAALASCLSKSRLPKLLRENAIGAALAAVEESQRWYGAYPHLVMRAFADVAPFLHREQVMRQILCYGLNVSQKTYYDCYDVDRSKALADLVKSYAPYLEGSLLEEALLIVRRLPTEYAKADILAKIAHALPESFLNEALTMARELEANSYDWSPRAMALVGLAPRLTGPLREDALQEALEALEKLPQRGGVHRFPWIEQLLELAPYLPETLKEKLFSDALASSRWVFSGDLRNCMMLSDLALHSPEPGKGRLLRRAFVGILIQPREEGRYGQYHPCAEGLAYLVPRLGRAGYLKMALRGLRMIERHPKQYCQAVSELAPYLSEPYRGEVLRKALALWRKARRLSRYEPSFDSLKELLWARIRASWDKADMTIPGNDWRRQVRNRLRGSVPDVLLRWMISVRRVVGNRWGWAMTLGRLAPYMSDALLREALAMVQQVEDSGTCELALAELAPRLAELDYVQALEVARAMYGGCRARALAGMMSYLPKQIRNQALQETLEAIEGDRDGEGRKKDFLVLLLSCPPGQFDLDALKQILPVVMGLKWPTNSRPVLKKLALHLMALPRPTLVCFWTREYEDTGFLHVLSRTPRQYLLPCIGALACLIVSLGGPEAAAETLQAIQDVKRWW
jgi:hypothetical protein